VAKNIKVIVSNAPLPDVSHTALLRKRLSIAKTHEDDFVEQLMSFSGHSKAMKASLTSVGTVTPQFSSHQFQLIDAAIYRHVAPATPPTSGIATAVDAAIRGFHVPFSFETTESQSFWTRELAGAEAELASLSAQMATLQADIVKASDMISAWQDGRVRDHRSWLGKSNTKDDALATLGSVLTEKQQLLQACEDGFQVKQTAVTSARNTLELLGKLSGKPVDPQSFVLGMVCTRTPKCPNPDPSLFGA
jgi:hypothetical protein